MTIKEQLSKKYRLPEESVELYINTMLRIVDNMLHMGICLNLRGILKAEHDITIATRYPQIGRNKRKIRSILAGKEKTTYICRIVNKKKIYNERSESEPSPKQSTPIDSSRSDGIRQNVEHVPAGEQNHTTNSQQVDSEEPEKAKTGN